MHSTLSDDELLRRMQAGDEDAFIALYRRQQGGLYRFALRMSGSEALAEDIVQEVFLILMRGNGVYEPSRGSFAGYLFGIARNQVLKRFEKERRLLPMGNHEEDVAPALEGSIAWADPLDDLTRQETIESVRRAVLSLPTHYREAVVLCDLHEMSYADAAVALGCAVGTVRSRLHRARALLAERLRTTPVAEPRQTDAINCFV